MFEWEVPFSLSVEVGAVSYLGLIVSFDCHRLGGSVPNSRLHPRQLQLGCARKLENLFKQLVFTQCWKQLFAHYWSQKPGPRSARSLPPNLIWCRTISSECDFSRFATNAINGVCRYKRVESPPWSPQWPTRNSSVSIILRTPVYLWWSNLLEPRSSLFVLFQARHVC